MEKLPAINEPKEVALIKVGESLFKSGLFPNVKNPFGAYAIVQYGHELGIGPMTALQTMAIISGKICMAGQMMLSIALKNGVSYRILKDSDEECQVSFKRDTLEYTSSFSIKEAKQAGIWRAQSGWEKFPRDMLFWRTVTRGLRRVAPDVILGLYAIEEIKDAPSLDAKVEEVPQEPPKEPPPPLTFDAAMTRMGEIKNVFELKAWWTKHFKEVQALTPEETAELTAYKDHLKAGFEGQGKEGTQ